MDTLSKQGLEKVVSDGRGDADTNHAKGKLV